MPDGPVRRATLAHAQAHSGRPRHGVYVGLAAADATGAVRGNSVDCAISPCNSSIVRANAGRGWCSYSASISASTTFIERLWVRALWINVDIWLDTLLSGLVAGICNDLFGFGDLAVKPAYKINFPGCRCGNQSHFPPLDVLFSIGARLAQISRHCINSMAASG